MFCIARMEPRDREWIRAGLQAGILSLPIIEARFAQTAFRHTAESGRARKALDEDRKWLPAKRARSVIPRRFEIIQSPGRRAGALTAAP